MRPTHPPGGQPGLAICALSRRAGENCVLTSFPAEAARVKPRPPDTRPPSLRGAVVDRMTSLLKRLSLSIERNQGAPSQQPGLVSHPSFNDFSFHIHQDCAEGEGCGDPGLGGPVRG